MIVAKILLIAWSTLLILIHLPNYLMKGEIPGQLLVCVYIALVISSLACLRNSRAGWLTATLLAILISAIRIPITLMQFHALFESGTFVEALLEAVFIVTIFTFIYILLPLGIMTSLAVDWKQFKSSILMPEGIA